MSYLRFKKNSYKFGVISDRIGEILIMKWNCAKSDKLRLPIMPFIPAIVLLKPRNDK